jgi:hypothetical protein
VEIGVDARDRILGDDHCIIVPPRLPRSELNTDICRDPTENDRDDPATTKLPIELGATEGIPSALDDDDISWERVNCGGELRPLELVVISVAPISPKRQPRAAALSTI